MRKLVCGEAVLPGICSNINGDESSVQQSQHYFNALKCLMNAM
jgi:hypothetical protein